MTNLGAKTAVEVGPKVEQRTLHINGLAMHVVLAGAGQPLLLLHGFPDSAQLWRKLIPGLVAAGFRVIAPDQRGFGLTSMPPNTGDYTIAQIVADAIALLDALGIERAALMGHDWGAIIGWHLAAEHPERFTRYVALSVGHLSAFSQGGFAQLAKSWYVIMFQLRDIAEAMFRANDFGLLRRMTGDDPEILLWRYDLSRPGRLTAGMNWYRANMRMLMSGSLGPARIPVLGIIGSADSALTITQMADSDRFAAAGFSCHIVDGAEHWLPLNNVAEIKARAIGFLKLLS